MSGYRRLVIVVDCDDVIVPTAAAVLSAYNQRYNTIVALEGFYSDSLWGASTPEEGTRRVDHLLQEGVTASIPPTEDAIEYINRLHRDGHELHVVTGRQSYQEPETLDMLDSYFPGVFKSVAHTNMYATGRTIHLKRSKGSVCAALGADVLVDDHVYHGRDVLNSGVRGVIVFGDYPWNTNEVLDPGMTRCVTWGSVYAEVMRIATES